MNDSPSVGRTLLKGDDMSFLFDFLWQLILDLIALLFGGA